jgi:hypothetical protein
MTEEPKIPTPPEAEKPMDPPEELKALLNFLLNPTIDDVMKRQIDDGRRLRRCEQALSEIRIGPVTAADLQPELNRTADEVRRVERELKALHDGEQKRVGDLIRNLVHSQNLADSLHGEQIKALAERVDFWRWLAITNLAITGGAFVGLIAARIF